MKLLVSVVDAGEARAAAAAGADIVDVKNPAEGSLGAPSPAMIERVRAAVPPALPVSVAIGDMPNLPGTAALAALGAARSGAASSRSGCGVSRPRPRRSRSCARCARPPRARWWWRAPTPMPGAWPHAPLAPELLPRVAAAAGVGVCLLDTAVKDGRGLFDWLAPDALAALVAEAHDAGLRWRWPAPCAPRSCRRCAPAAPTSPASGSAAVRRRRALRAARRRRASQRPARAVRATRPSAFDASRWWCRVRAAPRAAPGRARRSPTSRSRRARSSVGR